MQEYVYYSKQLPDFPLHEEIQVSNDILQLNNNNFLISNSKDVNSEVVANEIEFYIKNTKDLVSKKIENIKKLYDIASLKYDNAKDFTYPLEIGNRVLLIANLENAGEVMRLVKANEFDMFHIDESILKSIDGKIGELNVLVDDQGKDVNINVHQIIWFDAKEESLKQSGTYDPKKLGVEETLKTIRENINSFEYRNFTTYDKNICQYHERREDICGRCEEVCPTVAITKDETNRHLVFSQVDCHGCGGCISICPSGALDYSPTNKDSLYEMSLNFKNTHPLIIPQKMSLDNLNVELKENILPFKIEGEKFFHEATFLTLAQISSSQLIFYSDFLSKGTSDSINILNEIYQKKYGKDAILVAKDEKQLSAAISKVDFIAESYFNFNQEGMKKREIFSYRLKNLVGDETLGEVQTGPNVHYAHVKVNEANCTLCLSCVGACNVDAIFANPSDNTLRLNPSLCTSCGYCEVSCPESDCLTIQHDVIKLTPSWFKDEVLAQDELFACVECGNEFATKKAIEKIASIMAPIFKSDPIKEKTLYCCESCKPKIMMQSYMKNSAGYNNKQGVAL